MLRPFWKFAFNKKRVMGGKKLPHLLSGEVWQLTGNGLRLVAFPSGGGESSKRGQDIQDQSGLVQRQREGP